MAFKDSFNKSIQKSMVSSFTVEAPQQKNPLKIEKSGIAVLPTYQDQSKTGQEKEHSYEARLSSAILRKMYERNVVVRAAIDTIINEVVSAKYTIKAVDVDDDIDDATLKDQKERIKKIKDFFRHPNENRESFRIFLEKVLFDLLLYDAGVVEKVRDRNGKLKEMYAVAGDSIRIKINKVGKLEGYFQVLENSKEEPIPFGKNQLIYMIMNPRSHTPYGFPVLNTLENMVTAFLYGETYNIKYFENNATPRGILELGAINEAQLDRFREYWRQENLNQPHRVMVLSNPNALEGKGGAKWIPLAMSSKDMELMEYMSWLMKMILMAFGVTPSEVGFADEVKGAPVTGQVLQSQAFKNKTIFPMMDRIASFLTEEIIVAEFDSPDLEFIFEEEKSIQEEMQAAQRDMILIQAQIMTVDEIRKERGLSASPMGGQTGEQEGQGGGLEDILAGLKGEGGQEDAGQEEETIIVDSEESSEKSNLIDMAFTQLKSSILTAIGDEATTNDILSNLNSQNVEVAFRSLRDSINDFLKKNPKFAGLQNQESGPSEDKVTNAFNRLSKEINFYLTMKEINSALPKF